MNLGCRGSRAAGHAAAAVCAEARRACVLDAVTLSRLIRKQLHEPLSHNLGHLERLCQLVGLPRAAAAAMSRGGSRDGGRASAYAEGTQDNGLTEQPQQEVHVVEVAAQPLLVLRAPRAKRLHAQLDIPAEAPFCGARLGGEGGGRLGCVSGETRGRGRAATAGAHHSTHLVQFLGLLDHLENVLDPRAQSIHLCRRDNWARHTTGGGRAPSGGP